MKGRRGLLDRVALATELPTELGPGQTLVEIAGQGRVLIENHCGVTMYGTSEIRVKVSYGYICVCGSCLELVCMTKDQLVVTGRIDGVTLMRGKT